MANSSPFFSLRGCPRLFGCIMKTQGHLGNEELLGGIFWGFYLILFHYYCVVTRRSTDYMHKKYVINRENLRRVLLVLSCWSGREGDWPGVMLHKNASTSSFYSKPSLMSASNNSHLESGLIKSHIWGHSSYME